MSTEFSRKNKGGTFQQPAKLRGWLQTRQYNFYWPHLASSLVRIGSRVCSKTTIENSLQGVQKLKLQAQNKNIKLVNWIHGVNKENHHTSLW